MMFSSKTPRDLNNDPEPWSVGNPLDGTEFRTQTEPTMPVEWAEFYPRAEFDHIQHNEPNRILLAHREYRDHVAASGLDPVREHLKEVGEMFGTDDVYSDVHGHIFTYEELEHAYRVLTRLAALAREQD